MTVILLVLLAQGQTQADPGPFYVKQVTYSGKDVSVRCEADLTPNEESTLVITAKDDEKDAVLKSIHTGIPARISKTTAKNVTTITIKFLSETKKKAAVTFLTKITDTDSAFNITYGIEQSRNELDGYIQFFDHTGTNAEWKKTELHLKQLGDTACHTISMGAGESTTMPLPSLQDYPIKLDAGIAALRSDESRAHKVVRLINPGEKMLPKGMIRVMQKGVLEYHTELRADLSGVSQADSNPKSADLLVAYADATRVLITSVDEERWHETISLIDGVLTYKPWPVTVTTIENKTAGDIVIFLGDSNLAINVPGKTKKQHVSEKGPSGDATTTDLFALSNADLKDQIKQLSGLGRFSKPVPEVMIKAVVDQLKNILRARDEQAALTARSEAIRNRIKTLTEAGADEATLGPLVSLLTRIQGATDAAKFNETEATVVLTGYLFSQPATTKTTPSTAIDSSPSAA